MTGTLEHLDPTTLLMADNVRAAAALDTNFLSSVREHGVLQPITAARTEDGIEVRDGQRRTLAAREASLPTIPVYVLDAAGTDTDTAARITHQIVTNDHRAALTDAQRAKGINQIRRRRPWRHRRRAVKPGCPPADTGGHPPPAWNSGRSTIQRIPVDYS